MNDNFTFYHLLQEEKEKEKEVSEKKEEKIVEEEINDITPEVKKKGNNKEKRKNITKLALWGVFIIIIIIIAFTSGSDNDLQNKLGNIINTNSNNNTTDDKTKLNTLVNKNFHFKYILNYSDGSNNINNTYEGDSSNNSLMTKKSLGNEEYTWYYKKNNENYIFNLDTTKFEQLENNEKYLIIDEKYYDINNIISYIKLGSLDYTTTYTSNDIIYGYKVYVKDLLLDNNTEDYITISTRYNANNNIIILIDYTNYLKSINSSIKEVKLELYYTSIGIIERPEKEFEDIFGPKNE